MTAIKNLKLFSQEVKFVAGITKPDQFINFNLPEIVFWGKSNVGKSSLINTLFNHEGLAKVSNTPGRTQQINFFSVSGKFMIVDLPGYGFAQVPLSVKEKWEKLILFYLTKRESKKLVCLLIDARRGIKEPDIEVMKFLSSNNILFQIIYTKVDKVSNTNILLEQTQNLFKDLGLSCNVIKSSNRSKEGAKELRLNLAKYLGTKQ